MSAFDELLAADLSALDRPTADLFRACLRCPIDGRNHVAPPHPSLMKHYAEEAKDAPQRYVLRASLIESLLQAFRELTVDDICRMAEAKPASRMLVLVEGEGQHGIIIYDFNALRDDTIFLTFWFDEEENKVVEVEYPEQHHESPLDDPHTFLLMVFQLFCAAAMIPKMTVMNPVIHGEKLQKARIKRNRAPLVSYNVVAMPLARRGLRSAASFLEGLGPRKALHHVQAFVRMIADDSSPIGRRGIFVRDHWRGDPALGVRLTERRP